jgi:hypothetical protein
MTRLANRALGPDSGEASQSVIAPLGRAQWGRHQREYRFLANQSSLHWDKPNGSEAGCEMMLQSGSVFEDLLL